MKTTNTHPASRIRNTPNSVPTRRTQALYAYWGLGFRVNLRNVPMMQFDGEWVPDIDFNALENGAALALTIKPLPLTGAEVRFLRRHLGQTLDQLAARLGVTKQGVGKWELRGDAETGMSASTEKVLRMLVLEAKGVSGEFFKQAFASLFSPAKPRRKTSEYDLRRPIRGEGDLQALLQA